jgi:LPS export ABC transporter protein LptC
MYLSVFLACGEHHQHAGRMVTAYTPQERGTNIAITYTDSGALRARLFAPLVSHFKSGKPRVEMAKGLKVYFYAVGDSKKPGSELRADYGIKYELQQQVILKGDVVVVNQDHDTLNTELLVWDELHRTISSDKPVRIRKKDEILTGEGFESNEDFSKYKLFHITGILKRNVDHP